MRYVQNIFGITPSRDGKKGDITLNGAIETDQDGFYLIYVWARDEWVSTGRLLCPLHDSQMRVNYGL